MAKRKQIKQQRNYNENILEIRKFIILLLIITGLIVVMYFVTNVIIDKRDTKNKKSTNTAVEIDYDTVSVGTMLNRPYDEYYVIAYSSESKMAIYYQTLASLYLRKPTSIKLYILDTNSFLNSEYVAKSESEVNTKAKKIEDLKLGEITLIKVSNNTINQYINGVDDVKAALK